MTMPPGLRRFVLTAHVVSSVGALGAVAAFLALGVVGLAGDDALMVRAAYLAMDRIAWLVILPFLIAAFLIGLVQSLATSWGLFRHYWVLIKFLLTLVTLVVLLLQMGLIGFVADRAAETMLSDTDLFEERISLVAHAAGGLVVLVVAAVLSVYKPRGLTRYGWRRQQEIGAPAS